MSKTETDYRGKLASAGLLTVLIGLKKFNTSKAKIDKTVVDLPQCLVKMKSVEDFSIAPESWQYLGEFSEHLTDIVKKKKANRSSD